MAQTRVPDQMTAVVLDSYTGVEALRVEERPVPKPGKDEVLVKVAASPINPSDLAVLQGRYGFRPTPPLVPGGEGSGTVVAVGPGLMGRYFLGKRVACLWDGQRDGVWAEYVVTSTKGGALPLDASVSLEQGAMSAINPMTASAFVEIAKKGGHKAIVLTAAASALGQMVNRLGQSEGVQIINVVRRDAQVELLKQQGAAVILNSNEPNFDQQLHDACHQYEAHLAFDAVAGPLTGQLLQALPPHSKVTVFGALSFEAAQALPDQLIFHDKAVDGFWLGPWITEKNLLQILMTWRRAQKLLSTELRSEIRAQYPFQEAKKAVEEYLSQMTGGKILLKPNP
ncbi:MAG: zinc-binding dehydrogenase [Myxococcales bacterium]|nr:zinc-binding dehydrogenase [Myxococcales bacterium]MDH3483083.1 zinc-binding dehydrogenase [Myxococcales bacterium]